MIAELQRPRIKWSGIKKFTPAVYEAYSRAPIWELDDDSFESESDYWQYWSQTTQSFVTTAKAKLGKWQLGGREAARALEANRGATLTVFDFQSALAAEPLPLAANMVQERVALLSSNPPRPMAQQRQESQAPQVAALNQLIDMVLDDNNYAVSYAKGIYDAQFWNACCWRWNIDWLEPGLFGQPGHISLDRVPIDELFFDPECKELDCKYMDYVVQKHTLEYGEICAQYPFAAQYLSPMVSEVISDTSVLSRNNEDYIQSPQPKLARDSATRRQKITVLELWVKDSRLKFEPRVPDGRSSEYSERFMLDEDGYIIGDWVKRYPNGRLLVVAGPVVLKDCPNPYPHGQFPFVFAQGEPASSPYSDGVAQRIMIVTRKINNIIADLHAYYQSEVKRPMISTAGAIQDPNLAQQVPNDPTYIVELSGPAARFERRPPVDVPPSVYPYLQLMQATVDMTSGSSAVMRGNLSDGAQLSAEAMAALQSFASSRLALESKFFAIAAKQLGYQLHWILRAVVDADITVTVFLPTGQQEINWKSDREVFNRNDPTEIQKLRTKEDYLIIIKAGSGAPGAQQQQSAQALALFNDNAIDRPALLDSMQYPGRQDIIKRMADKEKEDLALKGFAKELGVNVNQILKEQERAGRRVKP